MTTPEPEQVWTKVPTAADPEVDRLIGLYEATQTPSREGKRRSDAAGANSSEVDRLLALARRHR